MQEPFDWMRFGDDTLGARESNAKPSFIGIDEDVPVFLREDAGMVSVGTAHATAAPGCAGCGMGNGMPAFLEGYRAADAPSGLGGGLSSAAAPARDDAGQQQQQPMAGAAVWAETASAVPAQSTPSAALYADRPSAAVLRFTGDSGHMWAALYRVRILGKGNYGCATLYSLRGPASGAVAPADAVVVKDVDMQTMVNPAEEMAALQTELQVLRAVRGHPNLVQYVDAVFDARPPTCPMSFILMEYCAGGDLAGLRDGCSAGSAGVASYHESSTAAAAGPQHLTEPFVASLFIQAAVALQSLHTEYGVLHRDVKPQNIFLLEDGVTVRLGDFGISVQLGRVGDTAKEACGSPFYMAPELFEERAYGAAADVWSLGVVFYELMALQLPFTAASAAELRSLVCRGRCTPLHELHNESTARYSRQFKELVNSLLTVDPAARPTLRRVLRHKCVRENLKYVPASVLTAKKPQPPARASPTGARPSSSSPVLGEDGLYAGVFGRDVVEQAVAQAVHAGVRPIVNRVRSP
ncbi:hypothetical protein LSCM1_08248 [Leishmania martiniquensis]|uniref:non-specific serine/threonine protein kinase n=1 Tax=Leishmania martiniquensis TaxID=1580590 RepID=A0A836I4S2_9TRYP|nr:hypothetical protein LSCM1_08248 [Leishmania martiniquensis]